MKNIIIALKISSGIITVKLLRFFTFEQQHTEYNILQISAAAPSLRFYPGED